MELEERLAKVRTELSPGNLVLETNVQVKVIRPVLRSLGWDDADSSHLRAEFRTDYGRVDEALLDEFGNPVVFIEAKKQGHLKDAARYDKALRQLFRYARDASAQILLLTDGETWDFYLRRASGPPAERRFLRLALTGPVGVEQAASDLRTFLSRDAVLEGDAMRAARARLEHETARSERRRDVLVAWRALLEAGHKTLRSLLADRVERDVGQRPPSAELTEFLREQGALALSGDDPTPPLPRPYTYDELFPDDRPRTSYTHDELEHLLPVEMSEVVEWWTDWWELEYQVESDPESDESSSDIAFVLGAQGTHDGWVTAANEIRGAAEEYDDVQTYLETMRMVELRQFAKRLSVQPGGRSKQDMVEALVKCLEWF
ncbi:type I restriction endonuclease [Candidatus Poriferisodalis sp.]|uniref:type I restriction endonuclease n=1 Tax=Candidatus Poriferisodalis sp. TaxID=3101277 RepID=UPI003B0166BD